MNNQDPQQDDPLLDDLEQSIEKPPGLGDFPDDSADRFMDDLGRRLDAVEESIEGAIPLILEPIPDLHLDEPGELPDEPAQPLEDQGPYRASEDSDELRESPSDDTPEAAPPVLPLPSLPGRRGGNIARRRRLRFPRGSSGRIGRRRVRGNKDNRFCPESHELIDTAACESCDKYRHWPEGTDQEPRECWHAWRARPAPDESEGDEQ